jgi:hypothetical protein
VHVDRCLETLAAPDILKGMTRAADSSADPALTAEASPLEHFKAAAAARA